jgi:hypothetical protein
MRLCSKDATHFEQNTCVSEMFIIVARVNLMLRLLRSCRTDARKHRFPTETRSRPGR